MAEPTPSGRRQLLVIMGIALITLGGSYLLFYFASQSGGWGTTNHGEFVSPPITRQELGWDFANPADGQHWFLWVVGGAECADACQQKVKDMRALHILLTAEAGRVRRAVSSLDGAEYELSEPFPKLQRVRLVVPGRAAGLREGVSTVDSNGNLVFYYAMDVDPKLILEDLKKLLKVSQIG